MERSKFIVALLTAMPVMAWAQTRKLSSDTGKALRLSLAKGAYTAIYN